MIKEIMKKFTGLRWPSLVRSAGLVKLGLVVLAGLTLSVAHAQPANDNFANAINLTAYGDTGSTNGSNVGATIEPGEQGINGLTVSASVWYSWPASTNETTEFDPIGSLFGTNLVIVQVFTNSASGIGSLQFVTFSYYGYLGGSFLSYASSFQAVAGQTYYISVAGYQYQSATGSIQLNWSSGPPLAPPPNDNFASATVLTGDWGSTNVDNRLATAEPNEPSHAGFPANASVWYQWTAPSDGEVTLDTIGSNNVDTVLAVYTGTSLATLSQVAANDDLYPINSSNPQINYSGSDYFASYFAYYQTFYGPSGLRFNARGGTTYYFAVDTKSTSSSRGSISLSWAYKSSGVFRFATEDEDFWTGMPLYQCAQTESYAPMGLNVSQNSAVLTYYKYNVPGALVTVTRVAGSSGRVTLDYSTEDGTSLTSIPLGDTPAIAGVDYTPVSGTLVFDDYEMSKTILVPISYLRAFGGGISFDQTNRVFGVVLSNPQLDYLESGAVSQPRVDPQFSTAMVKILNVNADPYGPDYIPMVVTNGFADPPTNSIPNLVTNNVLTLCPTNAVFNCEKAKHPGAGGVYNKQHTL